MSNPLVSCLCPTYGRFRHLRQALACFLAQDYEPKELVILNDHPKPIRCDYPGVRIYNVGSRYEGMGRKRQALLELARGEWAAQWDDDDFYLPWHLSHWLPVLRAKGRGLLKILRAFSSRGWGGRYRIVAHRINAYQSQNIFDVPTAREIGYGTSWIMETKHQVAGFVERGLYHIVEDGAWASMMYGWSNGTMHASASGESRSTWWAYATRNQDMSNDPLTPADLSRQLRAYVRFVEAMPEAADYAEPLAIVKSLLEGRRR